MTQALRHGWAAPTRAVDDSDGSSLGEQIVRVMEQIQGKYSSVWLSDHVHPPIFGEHSNAIGVLECFSTISYLAGVFPDFDFGTMVLSQPLRNPALVAKMGANLQVLTKGRFILGLGSGSNAGNEYVAYGYGDEFPQSGVRAAQTAESAQIIREMWTKSPANFEGKYYRIRNAYCEPRPNPRPPLLIACAGEQVTLRTVARYADWSNFGGDPDGFAHRLAVLHKHCEAEGRDFDEIVKTYLSLVAIAETETEAEQMAEAASVPFGPRLIAGTPEQVAAQLQPFVDLGVGYLITYFVDFPDPAGAILFAEEVIPRFHQ